MAHRNVNHTNTYRTEVQGNVVRKVRVEVPERREQINRPTEVRRRNRRVQSNTLSIPYCIFLTAACVLTLIFGANYLQQQALATKHQQTIASLESDLAEMRKVNADNLNRIETSINLEEIRDIAINELGMIYATEEHVVLYENTQHNYVTQYKEIPQK